jgi:hypothetical protein
VQDKITKLCSRLVAEDDPKEFRPVAAQLQSEIHERVERVRENALEFALVDQLVGWEVLASQQDTNESAM